MYRRRPEPADSGRRCNPSDATIRPSGMRDLRQVFAVFVVLLAAAGCAPGAPGPTVTSTAMTPPSATDHSLSSSAPTTRSASQLVDRPSTHPEAVISPPSDLITGFWVRGTITRSGPGVCYGLTVDDGRQFAMSGATIGGLPVGDRIKARVMATEQPIDCGPGEAMILLEVKRAG